MSEVTLTDQNFDEETKKSGIIMVDFWAAWCGPCIMMEPILEQVAKELDGKVRIAKLNVDENIQTAQRFNVTSIPVFKIFKNGELVDELLGAQGKDTIIERLNRHINA